MAECRQEWLSRLREESPAAPTDQAAAPSQAGHSSAADQAAAPSQAGHTNFIAAAPWEHAGNPQLTGAATVRVTSESLGSSGTWREAVWQTPARRWLRV